MLFYYNLASAIKPVPHKEKLLVLVFSVLPQITLPITQKNHPLDHSLFSRVELNNLVRNFNFPQSSGRTVMNPTSRKAFSDIPVCFSFFIKEENLFYCRDVGGLLNTLGIGEY